MRSVNVIFPFAFLAYSRAEVADQANADMQTFIDKLVDRLHLQKSPLRANLDSTAFGKPGRFATPKGPLMKDAIHAIPYTRPMFPTNPGFFQRKSPLATSSTKSQPEKSEAAIAEAEADSTPLQRGLEKQTQVQRQWLSRRDMALGAAGYAATTAILAKPKSVNAEVAALQAPTQLKDVKFKTFKLKAPEQYEEFPDAAQQLPGVFLFMANPQGGLDGNSVSLVKQPIENVQVKKFGEQAKERPITTADLGTVELVSEAVAKVEGASELISATERKDKSGLVYYQLDYKRKVLLGFERRTLTSLIIYGGLFYTLIIDMNAQSYDTPEGEQLRQAAASLALDPDYKRTPEYKDSKE